MKEAEEAQGEEAERLEDRCRRAILDLWKARHAAFVRPPLAQVEEVGMALKALRSGEDWYFRRQTRGDDAEPGPMQIARYVDEGARAIIRTLVGDAVRSGLAPNREWLWLVRSGLPDLGPSIELLREAVATSPSPGESDEYDEEDASIAGTNERAEEADRRAASGVASAETWPSAERKELVERLRVLASAADEIANALTGRQGEEHQEA